MDNITLRYGDISVTTMQEYLNILIGKTFKILPMKEESSHTLKSYIESYIVEIIGNKSLNPSMFDKNPQIVSLLATASFLANEDYDKDTCKREVFKCIRILEDLRKKTCGG